MKRSLLSALCTLLLLASACSVSSSRAGKADTALQVGVILEGVETSSADESIIVALKQAEADLGEKLKRPLAVHYRESGGDPNRALAALKELAELGVRYIVGPETSAEAAYLLQPASEEDVILISHYSTAPFLHTPDDNLFRLVPNDHVQAKFLASSLATQNVTDLIIIARNDVYGQQLSALTAERFAELGGHTARPLLYSPTITPKQWAEMLPVFEETLQTVAAKSGSRPAVLVAGFDETADLFALLNENAPAVKALWLTSEALAENEALLGNKAARSFLEAVNVKFASFTSEQAEAVRSSNHPLAGQRFEALAAYDALHIAALAAQETTASSSSAELRRNLTTVVKGYQGLSGPIELDEGGDRENVSFTFQAVTSSGK